MDVASSAEPEADGPAQWVEERTATIEICSSVPKRPATGGVRREVLSRARGPSHDGRSQLAGSPENPGRFTLASRDARVSGLCLILASYHLAGREC